MHYNSTNIKLQNTLDISISLHQTTHHHTSSALSQASHFFNKTIQSHFLITMKHTKSKYQRPQLFKIDVINHIQARRNLSLPIACIFLPRPVRKQLRNDNNNEIIIGHTKSLFHYHNKTFYFRPQLSCCMERDGTSLQLETFLQLA